MAKSVSTPVQGHSPALKVPVWLEEASKEMTLSKHLEKGDPGAWS